MILTDNDIRRLCLRDGEEPMIRPFSETVSGGGVISYGLSSAGYDLRLDREVLTLKNSHGATIDPKRFRAASGGQNRDYVNSLFDRRVFDEHDPVVIPAHGYILGTSYEHLSIPDYVLGTCVGKSTYARAGIIVNVTPLEPGWRGHLTIEISNSSPCPAVVYCMEGIAQLIFHQLHGTPEATYTVKPGGGKYQGQAGVTLPSVL